MFRSSRAEVVESGGKCLVIGCPSRGINVVIMMASLAFLRVGYNSKADFSHFPSSYFVMK